MKRVSWAVLLMAVFGLMSCGSRGHDRSDKLVQELTDSLALLARSADFYGFGMAIAGPDGVLYENGFGKADVASSIGASSVMVENRRLRRYSIMDVQCREHDEVTAA